jgi:hypothetical protein
VERSSVEYSQSVASTEQLVIRTRSRLRKTFRVERACTGEREFGPNRGAEADADQATPEMVLAPSEINPLNVYSHWFRATRTTAMDSVVREGGLEPPRLAAPDPKSGASAIPPLSRWRPLI